MRQKSAIEKLSRSTRKSKRKKSGMVNASSAGWNIKAHGVSFFQRSGKRGGSAIMDLLSALFDRFAPVVPLHREDK